MKSAVGTSSHLTLPYHPQPPQPNPLTRRILAENLGIAAYATSCHSNRYRAERPLSGLAGLSHTDYVWWHLDMGYET